MIKEHKKLIEEKGLFKENSKYIFFMHIISILLCFYMYVLYPSFYFLLICICIFMYLIGLMLLIWLYIGDPWTFGTPYESDEHLSAFGQM
jgi:hypothetical protein